MKFAFTLCIVACSFNAKVFSQTNAKAESAVSLETMHIQFDKDIYLPGETIWFKAYLRNTTGISFLSTNLYIGIYNDKGTLLQQKQYPIIQGAGNGDFELPDTIKGKAIQVRAFTKTMIDGDDKNFCQNVLTIYQKSNIANRNTILKNKQLQFYVEGGQMVAELENYIGFKASYEDGSPAAINGSIVEADTKKVVDNFVTNKLGIGKIILTPDAEKKYLAVWKDDNGELKQTALPVNHLYGAAFHAAIANDKMEYSIVKNKNNDSLSIVHLLFQMNNFEVYKDDITLEDEMQLVQGEFLFDKLPSGLMQITLFNKYWQPLQQRLVFVNHNYSKDQPGITLDTINTNAKGKNVITINLRDTFFTNLSASVSDINFYGKRTASINNDLYFKTQLNDLSVNIDSLLKVNDINNLDLILLTHSWKKYDWQKLTKEEKTIPADNYLGLSINYKDKNQVLPVNDSLILIIKNKSITKQFYKIPAANQTTFKKGGLVFFDSVKVSYQMGKNKELVDYLKVSRDEALPLPQNIAAFQQPINGQERKIDGFDALAAFKSNKTKDTTTLKEVVVKTKIIGNPILNRLNEIDRFYTSGMFSGTQHGYILNVLDDPMAKSSSDIVSYIAYRVPNVKIEESPLEGYRYFVVEEIGLSGFKKPTRIPVFLNEMQVESIGQLPLDDIAYIKYIPGIVIGAGFNSTVGVIYVYTKKGNEPEQANNNIRSANIKGYDQQKEFINPDFAAKEQLKQPDLRSTVYWKPSILLDKTNNKATIEFYNNDVSKKLLLTIEGINAAGELIHIEKIIE